MLQAFPYGDTSRIVRLLTRDAGVQSAIARGAMRPRSRYSLMEPFAQGTASLYIRHTRDLQTLGAFELSRSRQRVGSDLMRFGGASLLAEIVLRTASEEAQPGLFDTVARCLDHLSSVDVDTVEVTVLSVTWQVISQLGFAPELHSCTTCGSAIAPDIDASFDYGAGGLRCEACAAGLPGRRLPAHARAALGAFMHGEPVDVPVTDGHWRLLARYLDHHLMDGAPLRSLQFIAACS